MSATFRWFLGLYFLTLVAYSLFSYSLTAPNLILTSWPPYWNFQLYMWHTFFNNRELLAATYLVVISGVFLSYIATMWSLVKNKSHKLNFKMVLISLLITAAPLLISNNALSYDMFNYIFNAKMVVVFHANPHVKTALDYAYDDWTRFMHNVHTPAPYGYGWTALSLIPYTLGVGKFLLTWLSFRIFSFVSVVLLALVYIYASRKKVADLTSVKVVLFNPLLLIEIISTGHNDLWMMVPAVLSLLLLVTVTPRSILKRIALLVLSLSLLLFSASIKLATILLVPLWASLLLVAWIPSFRRFNWSYLSSLIRAYWPLGASLLMFVPLLTLRAQQFHPWYLTWVLVWLPCLRFEPMVGKKIAIGERVLLSVSKVWYLGILVLSFSSLLRYLPYLYTGTFAGNVLPQQKMISWIPFVLALAIWGIKEIYHSLVGKSVSSSSSTSPK